MRDRLWIVSGLAVFVVLITVPFWRARAGATDLTKLPNLTLPVNQKQCVAPVSYMRASHMQMLLTWREDVVRGGQRRYVAFNGKDYDMSLTKTCLGCHNKEQFCDRCHTYAGVSGPYCWNCHNQPPSRAAAAFQETMQQEAGAVRLAPGSLAHLLRWQADGQSSPSPRSMP